MLNMLLWGFETFPLAVEKGLDFFEIFLMGIEEGFDEFLLFGVEMEEGLLELVLIAVDLVEGLFLFLGVNDLFDGLPLVVRTVGHGQERAGF